MEDLFQYRDEEIGVFEAEAMELFANESGPDFFEMKDDINMETWPDRLDPFDNDEIDVKFDLTPKSLDCPILTNALTSSVPLKIEQALKKPVLRPIGEKIVFPGDVEPLQVSTSIQADSVLRRITQARSVLINGEKEIFGKNIIGLHCLNEIKTSPDKNCKITSTVMNGKKYKIIIKHKSAAPKSTSPLCEPSADPVKMEPLDDLISELQNGDYDVFGQDDVQDMWNLPLVEEPEEVLETQYIPPEPPRVPPLRIKIPKPKNTKKEKKKPAVQASRISDLLINIEKTTDNNQENLLAVLKKESSVSSLPDDSIPLDHDYCSYKAKQTSKVNRLMEKNPRKDSGLESGGASDTSEESPSPSNPHSPISLERSHSSPIVAKELSEKLLEEQCRPQLDTSLLIATNASTSSPYTKSEMSVVASTDQKVDETGIQAVNAQNEMQVVGDSDSPSQNVRPKKKLKLEEYLNRRYDKNNESILSAIKTESVQVEPHAQVASGSSIQILEEGEVLPPNCAIRKCSEDNLESKKLNMAQKSSLEECRQNKRHSRSDNRVKKRRRSCDETGERDRKRIRVNTSSEGKRTSFHRKSSSSTDDYSWRRLSGLHRGRSVSRERRRRRQRSRSSSLDSSCSSSTSSRRRSSLTSTRYRRRARSRSFSPYRSRSRERGYGGRRYPPPRRMSNRAKSPFFLKREKQRPYEERRVIYVGRIAEGTTSHHLRQRFSIFGPIVDISLHFREHGDNYGFVTFAYKDDACQALEHGNDDNSLPKYDLSFGGRRIFCKQRYSDLDFLPTKDYSFTSSLQLQDDSFDLLLKRAKAQIDMRKDAT